MPAVKDTGFMEKLVLSKNIVVAVNVIVEMFCPGLACLAAVITLDYLFCVGSLKLSTTQIIRRLKPGLCQ